MSKGINKVILIGNLGASPESSGMATKLKLATSESFKDKSGQTTERTEWHTVTFFGRLAEIVQQYLQKGSKIYVEGSLRTNKYTGKDGVERYSTEIIASNLQMLDSKASSKQESYHYTPIKSQAPAQNINLDDIDDDLPF